MATRKMQANQFTVANIAGGDERTFRLLGGALSAAALKHARNIGYGGPAFGGPAGLAARNLWDLAEEASLSADE